MAKEFIGKWICGECHGKGKVRHAHLLHCWTNDECADCNGKGYVEVRCDTQEEADSYTKPFEERRAEIEAGTFTPDLAAAGIAAVAGAIRR